MLSECTRREALRSGCAGVLGLLGMRASATLPDAADWPAWRGPTGMGHTDPKQIPAHHVACYRVTDGKRLWDTVVPPGPWLFSDLRGGYTAPTPACDGERLFVVFGSAVIAALDLDGKILWRKDIVPYKFDV